MRKPPQASKPRGTVISLRDRAGSPDRRAKANGLNSFRDLPAEARRRRIIELMHEADEQIRSEDRAREEKGYKRALRELQASGVAFTFSGPVTIVIQRGSSK
jgi:hypothetical protein